MSTMHPEINANLMLFSHVVSQYSTLVCFCLSGYDDMETREMLIQIGLEDIVNFPSREQIAFLLVERARLLDELAEAQLYRKPTEGHIVKGLSEVTVA